MAHDSLFIPEGGDPDDDDVLAGFVDSLPCEDEQDTSLLASDEEEGLWVEALAYDINFLKVPAQLKEICEGLTASVPEEQHEHPIFKHPVSEFKKAAVCPGAPKRRINVIGKSGAGKSSLLNSVMCLPGIAKASALGEGCTHVPSVYEEPFDDQQTAYKVLIECLSMNKIRKVLERLWHAYYDWHFEEHQEDWSDDEKQDAKQEAHGAFNTLRNLFCERNEFKNEKKATAFLLKQSKKSTEKVLDQLAVWCRDFLPTTTQVDEDTDNTDPDNHIPVVKFNADNADELHSLLEAYAFSDSDYEIRSMWPLVDRVRMGIRGVPILKYVTLVDWPGTGDTNQLRAKASTDRITDCDEVWIVSTMDRVVTEPIVWRALGHYASVLPCTIICTQIDLKCDDYDDINKIKQKSDAAETLKKLKQEEPKLQKEIVQTEKLIQYRREVKRTGYATTPGTPGNGRRRLTTVATENNLTKLAELSEQLEGMQKRLADLEQQRRQLITKIRANYFRSKLQDKIKQEVPDAKATNLFFVSSEHYMGNKGAKSIVGAVLTLKDTGIPAVRAHILLQASPDIVTTIHHYADAVDRVISGLGVTIKPEELEACEGVLQHIMKKQGRADQAIQTYIAEIEDGTQAHFVNPIKEALAALILAALVAVDDHRSWHAMTLKAFIRKDGDWATRTKAAQKWNEHFANRTPSIILENWDKFKEKQDNAFDQLLKRLLDELRGILQDAQSRNAGQQMKDQDGKFRALVETQIQHLQNECAKAKDQYTKMMKYVN